MRDGDPPTPVPGARLLFSLDPAVAHLDHGGSGAVPVSVQRAQQRLRDELESNPLRFRSIGLTDRLGHTRAHLAGFLGADPDGSALIGDSTTGVAMALQSVRLGSGDEVLLTDHGSTTVELATRRRCRRAGATSRTVAIPMDAADAEVVARIRGALRPGRTKLLIVDQVAASTAKVMPVAQIVAAARRHDIPVLVDATHVPGMLPVDVAGIGADFWVGDLDRWAFAPRGTALLSVAPAWRRKIEPLVPSGEADTGFPASVEFQGAPDRTAWLAAPAGLYVLRSLGTDRVREHNAALAAYGQRIVGAALGVTPRDLPEPGHPAAAMRVLPLPAGLATNPGEAAALRRQLADLAVEVAVRPWGGSGLLRLSAQIYNRPEDYDRLADRLPALLT